MKVSCKNPVVIRHKYIKEFISKASHYCIDGVLHRISTAERYSLLNDDNFLKKTFNTQYFDITKSELDDFYFVCQSSGVCYPMFQVLPCGKCIICRNRKTQQWMTRAHAENSYSETPPLFVTLTYNDLSIPNCGLLKEHCQLFMKRLRKRFADDGYDCNIRFFLCGEYGKNTHRPHYHVLLWNVPYLLYFDLLDYLQDAWSVLVEEEEYLEMKKKLSSDRFKDVFYTEDIKRWNIGIRDYEDVILFRKRIGFVYLLYVNQGAASYVMKYMRKEPTIPQGCVAPFQLYSRRGGIGFQWIDENKKFYHDNPDVLDVEIYDKWTKSTHKSVLPLYYTQRLFPSRSKLLTKAIRDVFDDWSYYGNVLNALRVGFFGMDRIPLASDILSKFDMLTPVPFKYFKDLIHELVIRHQSNVAVNVTDDFFNNKLEDIKSGNFKSSRIDSVMTGVKVHYTLWNHDSNSPDYGKATGLIFTDEFKKWCTRLFYDYSREYTFLSELLRSYPLDKQAYEHAINLKGIHDVFVEEFVRNQPEMDLDGYSDYLNRRICEAERKEIF